MHSNPILQTGSSLEQATGAMIMVHGRGADAESILSLSQAFERPDWAYLAPQADNHTWYPQRFIEPVARNQPALDFALAAVGQAIAHAEAHNIPRSKIVVLGFSQGACLALEWVARNGQGIAGVVALSGGLIGEGTHLPSYSTDLTGTTAFLGCSDRDFHIAAERVRESASVFEQTGATVDMRLYPNMGHTVNDDEIGAIQALLKKLN
ncbi:alpha/beta hydrolase [Herpetosiphon sp. NSE202]|uniref:alpha/beta hydrolase n=1 Tax=Herpetosiphon sp. NSE202 TaxID=3351349 RepID=UPI00363EA0D0